ncbi:MAG: hypothetical protein SGJ10_05775 [Bacteroidota bacterium]|nr:hypothetical protein [Bacteroidota bacterium]
MKKYILFICSLLLVSISIAQPVVTAKSDEPNSYRNTHIAFEYLNFKVGNYENTSNNSTALAAGSRIDTELRKLKLSPRVYFENSYLSGLVNKTKIFAGINQKYSDKYIPFGYSNFEIGCGYNLLTFKYKGRRHFTLKSHYDGVAMVNEKSEDAFPVTYRHVLQPRIGLNFQTMKEYNNIKVLQLGGALTRNFYAEVHSNKHGTCVSSNWLTIYYDILIGMGNKGPMGDSTFRPKTTKTYYRFNADELRKTGWRFGMTNRGDVFAKGSI